MIQNLVTNTTNSNRKTITVSLNSIQVKTSTEAGIPESFYISGDDENDTGIMLYINTIYLERNWSALGITSEQYFQLDNGTLTYIKLQNTVVVTYDQSGNKRWVTSVTPKVFNKPEDPNKGEARTTVADWPDKDPISPFIPLKVPGELYYKSPQVRFGYTIIDSPISYIQHSRQSRITQLPIMRSTGTIKKGTGQAYENYTISFTAHGPAEIANSVKGILEQITLSPFLTVEGGPFGVNGGELADIPHRSIAVRNFSISTVAGFPNSLQVDLNFDPFMSQFYLPPQTDEKGAFRHEMDDFICWPLVKLWAKTRNKSTFTETEPFNGNFKLYYPDPTLGAELDLILDAPDVITNSTDYNALVTLKNTITGGEDVTSKHLKKVLFSQEQQTGAESYIFKADTKELFNAWKDSEFYVGLVRWENLANANIVDFYGNLHPSSVDVQPSFLTQVTSSFNHREVSDGTIESNLLVIFKQGQAHASSMEDQIRYWVYDTLNGGNEPNPGDANYNEIISRIEEYQARPWEIFALYLKVPNTRQEALLTKTKDLIATLNGGMYYKYENSSIRIFETLKNTSLKSLILDGSPDKDIIIESIGGSRGHNLAMLSQRGQTLPIHQYMGGMDATFVVQGKCFSAEAKDAIEKMKIAFDERCINKTSKKYLTDPTQANVSDGVLPSLMYVDNEIFHLLGVDFVMPVTVTMQSIDGQPNAWDFTLTFIEYDPKQKKAEEVKFVPTTWQNIGRIYEYGFNWTGHNPLIDRAIEYFNLQSSLEEQSLFPDMQLPTKNELRFWLNSIYKGAKAYKVNHGIFRTSPSKSVNKDLSQEEYGICQLVSEYIEEYSEEILDSFTFQGESFSDISSYADPDFFIYYDHSQTFNTIFDDIAQHLMGGKDGKLHAKGRSSDEEGPIPGPYREYDPNYGTTSVFSHSYWAANPESVEYMAETVTTAENFTFPQETYKKAKRIAEEAGDKLDQTPGAWWTALFQVQSQTLIDVDQKSVAINPAQEKEWGTGWETDSKSMIPIPVGAEGPILNVMTTLEEYFTYQWRQKMAVQAAGAALNTESDSAPSKSGDFLYMDDNLQRFVDKGGSMVDLEAQAAIDIIKGGQPGDGGNPFEEGNPRAELRVGVGTWLYNTAGLNKGLIQDDPTLGDLTSGKNSLIESWGWVNAVGRRFRIDPNLIRAVFLYRSNFGEVDPQGSADVGYGDYRVDRVGKEGKRAIIEWCKVYSTYITKYKVPSLALLATDIELSSAGNTRRNKITEELADKVKEDFERTASQINERLSKETVELINLHLQRYGSLGIVINEYFATYISLCRVYGSYYNPSLIGREWDPFFFPMHRLIVMDIIQSDGMNGSTNNPIINTAATPTGENASTSSSRQEVSTQNPYLKQTNFDKKNLSPEVLAKLGRKMRAGLDPQSEGSIYGMLIDMRTHSSFGRLRGAFPAFQVLLINEGYYWLGGNKKLWDQFYTRTGIASIEVHRSRHMPASTATITFSNMFHYITAYSLTEAMAHNIAVRNSDKMGKLVTSPLETPGKIWRTIGEMWNAFVVKGIPDDVKLIWQNNHLKRLALNVGTRIQIRMGYGSNAATLPVVFNGSVMNAPVDEDMVTLTCVSDGYELEKPTTTKLQKANSSYAFVDGGAFGLGADPSSIVTGTLVAATNWDNITQGNFRDFSGGIAHFGDTYFDGLRRYPAEVQINIYSPRLTVIEQGIPEIQRFNIINGITNWGNERNNFTVSVEEPTPWKVMEVCRRACLDFVAAAEPFANRSTVFFGKWWWPYNFGYSADILNINPQEFQGAGFETTLNSEELHLSEMTKDAILKNPSNLANYGKLVWVTPAPNNRFQIVFYYDSNLVVVYEIKQDYKVKADWGTIVRYGTPIGGILDGIDRVAEWAGGNLLPDASPAITSTWLNDPDQVLQKVTVYTAKQAAKALSDRPTGTVNMHGDIPDDYTKIDPTMAANSLKQYANVIKAAYGMGDKLTMSKYDQAFANAPASAFTTTVQRVPLDFMNDTNTLVSYLLWKPYMQAHIAHSGINLLDNKIEADASKVYTDAIGTHQYNGWLSPQSINRTIVFSLDTDIHPADRKTMMVDTGLLLTGMQGGGDAIAQDLLSLPGRIPLVGGLWNSLTGGFQSYIEENPTTPAIENGVISALCDQAKEMYQGWFTIIGSPTIKPRDLFLLTDHITDLRGPVFVKDVIHRMDAESGFITLVSPDAVVLHHSSTVALQTIKSLTAGVLGRTGATWIMKSGVHAFVHALTHKATKGIRLADSLNLQRYNWLKSKGEIKDTNKYVLNALNGPIESTKTKKVAELTKKLEELNKDVKANAEAIKTLTEEIKSIQEFTPKTTREAFDWLTARGVSASKWFDLEGVEKFKQLHIRQLIFEEELAVLKQKYLEDIAEGAIARFANKTEALEAVEKMLNNRRAAFILNNLEDFMSAPDAKIYFNNIKELQELITIRQAGNVGLDAAAIAKNTAKEAKLLADLKESAHEISILFNNDLNLSTEVRRLLALVADGKSGGAAFLDDIAFIAKSFGRELVGTPGTILRGGGEGAVEVIKETGKLTKSIYTAIRSRKAMALFPSLKNNFYFQQIEALSALNKELEAGKTTAEAVKIAQAAIKADSLKHFLKSWEQAKRICNILSYMGPQVLLKAAFDISIMIIFNSFIEGINARFRARQCVKIIPLMSGDVPYVAGIKGHQGCVIGDSPSWGDELLSGSHKSVPGWMSQTYKVGAAILGVELPEYGVMDQDQEYIDKIKADRAQSLKTYKEANKVQE